MVHAISKLLRTVIFFLAKCYLLTLQHKSAVRNAIRPRLDSRSNSNQGEGAGLSVSSFGAAPVSYLPARSPFVRRFFFFPCVCVGCTFPSGEERPALSPGPDDSLYFTSLHFSLPVSQGGIPSTASATYNAALSCSLPKAKGKKNPSQGPPKNSWLALLLFPPCSFFAPFPFLLSNRPVGNVQWVGGDEGRGGAKMSGSPCHGASNQRGEKAQASRFDTVRWPGKLKTQLKWQHRGQLLCISKALLWPFCANYIR